MKKLFLMFILSFFIVAVGPLTPELGIYDKGSPKKKEKPEQLKPLSDVMLYCNTRKFVDNMVSKAYKMQLAAGGLVHDDRHKHLANIQVWINPNNSQWAIVYVYKKQDRSCVLGGNDIKLYTP